MNEIDDFVNRCVKLHSLIELALIYENSNRVKIGVLLNLIKRISLQEDNPKVALQQVKNLIDSLIKEIEND